MRPVLAMFQRFEKDADGNTCDAHTSCAAHGATLPVRNPVPLPAGDGGTYSWCQARRLATPALCGRACGRMMRSISIKRGHRVTEHQRGIVLRVFIARMRHDGCGGRAGRVEQLTGIEGAK
jgi:hypothetical protein